MIDPITTTISTSATSAALSAGGIRGFITRNPFASGVIAVTTGICIYYMYRAYKKRKAGEDLDTVLEQTGGMTREDVIKLFEELKSDKSVDLDEMQKQMTVSMEQATNTIGDQLKGLVTGSIVEVLEDPKTIERIADQVAKLEKAKVEPKSKAKAAKKTPVQKKKEEAAKKKEADKES